MGAIVVQNASKVLSSKTSNLGLMDGRRFPRPECTSPPNRRDRDKNENIFFPPRHDMSYGSPGANAAGRLGTVRGLVRTRSSTHGGESTTAASAPPAKFCDF